MKKNRSKAPEIEVKNVSGRFKNTTVFEGEKRGGITTFNPSSKNESKLFITKISKWYLRKADALKDIQKENKLSRRAMTSLASGKVLNSRRKGPR